MWEPTSHQYYECVPLAAMNPPVATTSDGSPRGDKDKWIDKERQRWASLLNVPMKQQSPPNFPPRTLTIMRALAALQELDGGRQDRLVGVLDALWHEFFVKHTQTHELHELRRILTGVLGGGAEADGVLKAASSDAEGGGKKTLMQNTEVAFKGGAFGLPWMACTRVDGQSESFWGVDHLGQVASFLGLEKLETGWKALL